MEEKRQDEIICEDVYLQKPPIWVGGGVNYCQMMLFCCIPTDTYK